jgi:hypothetical protein
MGLDMYLNRKTYIGLGVKAHVQLFKVEKDDVLVPMPFNDSKVKYIEEEVGYWRKANAIHK